MGIWGIWSLLWALEAMDTNFASGIDVTREVAGLLEGQTYDEALSVWIKRNYNA
jgi:hypothetical protein